MNKKYIIYTPSFNINNGGAIVLHYLCHLLNTLRHKAYVWDKRKPIFQSNHPVISIYQFSKYYEKSLKKPFLTNPSFNTPIASKKNLVDAIIIYPEIVEGNPLNVKNTIRWLLHKPGFHSGKIDYGKEDLIIGYSPTFTTKKHPITNNILNIQYIMKDIYKQTNLKKRSGECYMVRKGTNKNFIHSKDAINVDNYTHEELSQIFNKMEKFISYDLYTYYSIYATLCGCISIVIPDKGIPKEEWQPKKENRYGIAYGLNDIEYANKTKHLLVTFLEKQEEDNIQNIQNFIKLVEAHYE